MSTTAMQPRGRFGDCAAFFEIAIRLSCNPLGALSEGVDVSIWSLLFSYEILYLFLYPTLPFLIFKLLFLNNKFA